MIKFYLHSWVDFITNSSTEMYVTAIAGSENKVHNLINSLLEFVGSKERSEELFDVIFTENNSFVDRYNDYDTPLEVVLKPKKHSVVEIPLSKYIAEIFEGGEFER